MGNDRLQCNFLDYVISNLKIPQDADVALLGKNNKFMISHNIPYAFKDLIETDKNYAKFYETNHLIFYAKKVWLQQNQIAF